MSEFFIKQYLNLLDNNRANDGYLYNDKFKLIDADKLIYFIQNDIDDFGMEYYLYNEIHQNYKTMINLYNHYMKQNSEKLKIIKLKFVEYIIKHSIYNVGIKNRFLLKENKKTKEMANILMHALDKETFMINLQDIAMQLYGPFFTKKQLNVIARAYKEYRIEFKRIFNGFIKSAKHLHKVITKKYDNLDSAFKYYKRIINFEETTKIYKHNIEGVQTYHYNEESNIYDIDIHDGKFIGIYIGDREFYSDYLELEYKRNIIIPELEFIDYILNSYNSFMLEVNNKHISLLNQVIVTISSIFYLNGADFPQYAYETNNTTLFNHYLSISDLVVDINDNKTLNEKIADFCKRIYKIYDSRTINSFKCTMVEFIIVQNAGGCSNSHHDNTVKFNGTEFINRTVKNNDCFFIALKEEIKSDWFYQILNMNKKIDVLNVHIIKRLRGMINSEIKTMITIEQGLEFCRNFGINICIIDGNSYREYIEINDADVDNIITLLLLNCHYYRCRENLKIKLCEECEINYLLIHEHVDKVSNEVPVKKCTDCGQKYKNKHKCNVDMVQFYNNKICKSKARNIICKDKTKYKIDNGKVLCWDIETRVDKSNNNKFVTNVLGYTDITDNHKFKYFTDEYNRDPIAQFVQYLELLAFKMDDKDKIYLCSYNGRRFDCYPLMNYLLKKNIKLEKFLINNGSIVSLEFFKGKIVCFDLNGYLSGSLRDNLINFKCNVLKGDFDYNKLDKWENMNETDRSDMIKYLEGDCLGLKELFDKFADEMYNIFKMNIIEYISLSQYCYNYVFKSSNKQIIYDKICSKYNNVNKKHLTLELCRTKEECDFYRQSIYAGRTYNTSFEYESNIYKNIDINEVKEFDKKKNIDVVRKFIANDKEINYENINDYMSFYDVCSLYPAAMINEMPIGEAHYTDNAEKISMDYMGIYECEISPNKNINHAYIPMRGNGKLIYTLDDSIQVINTVDIKNMIKFGYKIKRLRGYYWLYSYPIYKDYIEMMFVKKAENNDDKIKRNIYKLCMNSVYGKLLQKPIYDKTEIVNDLKGYFEFQSKHQLSDVKLFENNIYLKGIPNDIDDRNKSMSKPIAHGSFVLSYSRQIMFDYFDKLNLMKDYKNTFMYTDTDSVLIKHSELCKEEYNIVSKNSILGNLLDDLDGGKVIRALCIRPKLYHITYVNSDNEIKHKFASAGIDKNKIKEGDYINMINGGQYHDVRDFKIEKVNVNVNSVQVNNGYDIFSLYKHDSDSKSCNKIINDDSYNGRLFFREDGHIYSVPFGHKMIKRLKKENIINTDVEYIQDTILVPGGLDEL